MSRAQRPASQPAPSAATTTADGKRPGRCPKYGRLYQFRVPRRQADDFFVGRLYRCISGEYCFLHRITHRADWIYRGGRDGD